MPVYEPVPQPATGTPPDIASTGEKGSTPMQYALANHTHASRLRRARLQSASDGSLTWTFSPPFDVGVIPTIQAIAETGVGVQDVVNVQIEGVPTNTSVTVRVTRTQRSVVALLGLTILSIPGSVGATWVHLTASSAS